MDKMREEKDFEVWWPALGQTIDKVAAKLAWMARAARQPERGEAVAWVDGLPKDATHTAVLCPFNKRGLTFDATVYAFKYEAGVLMVFGTDSDGDNPKWERAEDRFVAGRIPAVRPLYAHPPAADARVAELEVEVKRLREEVHAHSNNEVDFAEQNAALEAQLAEAKSECARLQADWDDAGWLLAESREREEAVAIVSREVNSSLDAWANDDHSIWSRRQVVEKAVRRSLGRGALLVGTVDVDWLANLIRNIDGNHSIGAGQLAERLAYYFTAHPTPAAGPVAELEAQCSHLASALAERTEQLTASREREGRMREALEHYEDALLAECPDGATGCTFVSWNKARAALAAEKGE